MARAIRNRRPYILFNRPQWPEIGENMNHTTRTARLVGFMLALLMTLAINASMLWQFDHVAQEATLAAAGQSPSVVTLAQVNILAPRS